ncbi:MAG: phosphohydrolase [Ignavibacteria bacterium]
MPTASSHAIEQTVAFVKGKLSGEGTGHDWFHTERVWKTAVHIAESEAADVLVVELAALLHDIADWKFAGGDESAGPHEARHWLEHIGVDGQTIAHVCDIIVHLSFKGAGVQSSMSTKEGMVVQDADRLDALGAIGIARAFAYGGFRRREIHNPAVLPVYHATFEQYKNGSGTTINHFFEKLLLLKDTMNTATARAIAERRHAFMEEFLREFYAEWDGTR